jgi:hypothetical protein
VTDFASDLGIAVLGGVIASVLTLAGVALRQWYLDRVSEWPYRVKVIGIKPLGPELQTAWEARIWITNLASFESNFLVYPKAVNDQFLPGYRIYQGWDSAELSGWLKVAHHDRREFKLTGTLQHPAQLPKYFDLRGAASTLKVRSRKYRVKFTHQF